MGLVVVLLTDPRDPNVARQNPQDYIDGMVAVVTGAIEQARRRGARIAVDAWALETVAR